MPSTALLASLLDSLQDVSSLALGALAFAALFLLLKGWSGLSALELIGLLVSVALLAYLLVALVRPERFYA